MLRGQVAGSTSAEMRTKKWLRSPVYAGCVQESCRNVEVVMAVQESSSCARK